MSALTRRSFFASSAGAALAGCAGVQQTAPERPPNILFLLTDDQRWDTLGAAGNRFAKTPNMDRLAGQGVLFRNSFVTTAICAVSRASFFTGLYSRCHGVHGFRTPLSAEQHAISYPVRLRDEAGYRSGFVGKYGVGKADTIEDSASRFDFWRGWPGQNKYLVEGRPHMTEMLGDQSLEFLDTCTPDQPWTLSVSFKAPHVQDGVAPYFINDPKYDHLYDGVEPPELRQMDGRYYDGLPEFLKEGTESRIRWERRFPNPEKWEESVKRYYALIYGVDVQIGRMLERLETSGALDNTVVVFTGDHGFFLGERGWAGKWYPHEHSIRTPLIIADPRRPEMHGTTRDETVLNIDISPTLQSLAGLEPPATIQGRDLSPLVAGERPAWRTEFFYEHLFEHPRVPKSEGVRTDDWKYFQFPESEPLYEEMYHLAEDPWEDHNLVGAEEHAEQLDHLRARREAWIANLESWRLGDIWSEPV